MERKSKLQMIELDKLHPHPQNPRKVIGDVTELAESIKVNGILQNLTVVPNNDDWDDKSDFTVVIGHRRLAAAKQAGLTELPCAIVEMSEKEQLSTMLTENMQRSDLTVYEEAKGCQMLLDLGDTVAEIAEKTGFSESKIRRRIKLCELDEEAFKESQIRQPTLQDYDRLNQIKDIDVRNKLLESIGTNNFNNLLCSAVQKQTVEEERKKIEKLCLEHGMTKVHKYNEIPSNYEYTGVFALKDLIGKDFADGKKRYFYFAYSSNAYIYTEAFKKQEKNDAEEEKRKLERQIKKQKWDELVAQAVETDKRCKNLREGFIRDTNFNDNDSKQELIKYIIYAMSTNGGYDEEVFGEFGGLKYDEGECINLDDCFYNIGKTLMSMAYAFFQGFYDDSYIDYTYGEKITRNVNPELNRFYNLLCKLGYVMSDEEKQLRDGTHPIFTTGEIN